MNTGAFFISYSLQVLVKPASQSNNRQMTPKYHLAQLNIARLIASIDDPLIQDFVDNLDRINAIADEAPLTISKVTAPTP